MRRAVSVTIDEDNLLWLKAQAAASAKGSLSDVLDRLVSSARAAGRTEQAAIRSIKGTIDIPDDDPELERASASVRQLFQHSLRRPMLVKETPPRKRGTRRG
jgi:hypothetical protein